MLRILVNKFYPKQQKYRFEISVILCLVSRTATIRYKATISNSPVSSMNSNLTIPKTEVWMHMPGTSCTHFHYLYFPLNYNQIHPVICIGELRGTYDFEIPIVGFRKSQSTCRRVSALDHSPRT